MTYGNNFAFWVVVGVAAILLAFAVISYFSPEARERRRRRKNYGRVISRARGPVVQLRVNVPRG
jgi:peptidoglycan/LPS O-acetylase OafA/YrhL